MRTSSELKNLHYAQNAPKILLEVISARSALVILASTYIFFLCCFVYDVNSTVKNFSGGINSVGTGSCSDIGIDGNSFWKTGGKWGCTLAPHVAGSSNPGVWVGRVGNLTNVISVALRFNKMNITTLQIGNRTLPVDEVALNEDMQSTLTTQSVDYTLNLYACFHSNDCSRYSDRAHKWHTVLSMDSVATAASGMFSPDFREVHHSVCGNTFQNQESLPTKGLVRSYLAVVEFWGDGVETVVEQGQDGNSYTEYEFLTISRTTMNHEDFIRPVLMGVTCCIAISFIWTAYQHNPIPSTWLRERKWIVFYFFALIVYQNPPYILITSLHRFAMVPSSTLVFLTYACDAFGQASFFLIWLLFADGSNSRQHLGSFYAPKLFVTWCIFASNMLILTMQFPSLYASTNSSFPTLAVYNWSQLRKKYFIFFSLSFLLLLIIWSILWYHTLKKTTKTLQKLPYMSTRYLQLSFRFFSLQATLVAIYYLFEYGVVIFLIMRNSSPVLNQHLNNISDNVNTLFRHQTLLVGKVVFLTVYSIILAILYLPASDGNRGAKVNEALSIFSATYTIQEVEMNAVVKARRKAIKKKSALSNFVDTKAEVFCVDLALMLLDAANEAYYEAATDSDQGASSNNIHPSATVTVTDTPKWSDRPVSLPPSASSRNQYDSNWTSTPTSPPSSPSSELGQIGESSQQAGSYGEAHWESYGYEIINQKYHATHDTYVYIGRHVESGKIIVAFRGTSSTKHWKNNFQYGLKEVDFMKLSLPDIDDTDNLDVAQYIDLDMHGVDSSESESDDECDDDDEEEDDEDENNIDVGYAVKHPMREETGRDVEYARGPNSPVRKIKHKRKLTKKRRSRGRSRSGEHQNPNPVVFVADTVREVGGVVLGATSSVVGATTGLFTAAVAHAPIINKTVKAYVHSGFWDCYIVVREFIHETLRKEIAFTSPDKCKEVYFTGHSLGGVIACFAALDFTLYSKDRIDKYTRHLKLSKLDSFRRGHISRAQWQVRASTCDHGNISVGMYSYGAPKPGNWMFSHIYDKVVPNSFRVVVDGDIVSGLPPTMGYQHIGTQVVIDKFCSGSIIVDPSFVERRLRTSTKTSITAHILALYKQSLTAIRDASMYIQQIGVTASRNNDSSDGREEFNRAKREVDSESADHFFLEKIYGLLNKSSKDSVHENNDTFLPLPQDSGHDSIDSSGRVGRGQADMDVSIRGSDWKSSSSFGYDDTFTLNTSEHGDEENVNAQEENLHPSRSHLFEVHTTLGEDRNALYGDDDSDNEDDRTALSLSNITSRPVETLLNVPFNILKSTTNVFQNIVLGVENIRVNENQVESMMVLQRSTMQRSEDREKARVPAATAAEKRSTGRL